MQTPLQVATDPATGRMALVIAVALGILLAGIGGWVAVVCVLAITIEVALGNVRMWRGRP